MRIRAEAARTGLELLLRRIDKYTY